MYGEGAFYVYLAASLRQPVVNAKRHHQLNVDARTPVPGSSTNSELEDLLTGPMAHPPVFIPSTMFFTTTSSATAFNASVAFLQVKLLGRKRHCDAANGHGKGETRYTRKTPKLSEVALMLEPILATA